MLDILFWIILFWIIVIIAVAFIVLRFFIVPANSKLPKSVQLPTSKNHTLSPCPDTPNCVSSTETRSSHKIDAINFEGSTQDAMTKIKTVVAQLPKSQIITEQDNYLHVVSKSPLMSYVDDIEFVIETKKEGETSSIQVRSAARLGRRDFDKNRERIELIRKQFQN